MKKFHLVELNKKYGFDLENEKLPFVFADLDSDKGVDKVINAYTKVELIWNSLKNHTCPESAIDKFAFPRGNIDGRIMVVSQNPGGHGERDYFTIWADGPNSKYLMSVVKEAKVFDKVWFTNLFPYATENNRVTEEQVYLTESLLTQQFDIIQPHVVIGLGGLANKHVRRLFGDDVPIIGLNHPAYVRRFLSGDPKNRENYVESFRCAKDYIMEEEEEHEANTTKR